LSVLIEVAGLAIVRTWQTFDWGIIVRKIAKCGILALFTLLLFIYFMFCILGGGPQDFTGTLQPKREMLLKETSPEPALIKKKIKIFLILYKEMQNGAVAKSYMTNVLLIYC
jgi:hypothetical protein